MDPVNYQDEKYLSVKETVGKIVHSVEGVVSYHDFRYTGLSEHELLILEVVVDSKNTTEESREKIRKELEEKLHEEFKTARIMITIELDVTVF